MSVKVKGEFVIGGTKYIHPLTSDEIRYLLTILKGYSFKGDEIENLAIITIKLQDEYTAILKKEEQTNNLG
jgi:hypothetical protein